MLYIPDTNVLITPFHRDVLSSIAAGLRVLYPDRVRNDVEAVRWMQSWYTRGFESGSLIATDQLIRELDPKNDVSRRLVDDLKKQGRLRILRPTSVTWGYLADIERFVRRQCVPQQAHDFLRGADPVLIAIAKTHGATIITLESYEVPRYDRASGRIGGKVRLPYVAWVFGVQCISLYGALQDVAC